MPVICPYFVRRRLGACVRIGLWSDLSYRTNWFFHCMFCRTFRSSNLKQPCPFFGFLSPFLNVMVGPDVLKRGFVEQQRGGTGCCEAHLNFLLSFTPHIRFLNYMCAVKISSGFQNFPSGNSHFISFLNANVYGN